MRVVKRNGSYESISFDKVLQRIRRAARGLSVNPDALTQQILGQIYDGVKTEEIDELTAQTAASLSTGHPDWATLAARIAISNHHKKTSSSFCEVMKRLASQAHPKTGEISSYIHESVVKVCTGPEGARIDSYIQYDRDYAFDYFGFKTLERGYLLRDVHRTILERPQHLWMRVALALWPNDLARAFETYDMLSMKKFTHATPTLFSAGTPRQQLSSCFVAGTPVFTMNGVKNIENVEIGDEVVTHTGSIKKVRQLHTNLLGNRKIYSIKIAGTPLIKVTGNHRLLSLSDEQEKWKQEPQWNRVDYLRTGDWIAIPKKKGGETYILDVKDICDKISSDGNNMRYSYTYTNDKVFPEASYVFKKKYGDIQCSKKCNSFNRYWVFDETLMELMGIWYGDGCIVHSKNSARILFPRSVNIVSYYNNEKLIEFVTKSMEKCFGIEHVTLSTDHNGMTTMSINNTIIAHIFKYLFKSGFDGKRLPDFFNTLPYSHIRAFLAGLVSSDGCVARTKSIQIQLTNPELVSQIFHLSRSVGIPATLTYMTTGDKKPTGRITIPFPVVQGLIKKHYEDDRLLSEETTTTWNCVKEIHGNIFMRLNEKTLLDESPLHVYTLGVEDDHSYSVGGIIAENCFLLSMKDDSIQAIFDTLRECAMISKYAGGIGLHIHNIRAKGAGIRGTNGVSDGLAPMLRVFNNTARYVNQGGRRNGSFAVYLEPWHADVEDFLKLKMPTGAEEERARDLFYALWIPDLFMKRVEEDGEWSLFCPDEAPGLSDVWGEAFEKLYTQYESEGRARRSVSAQKLWFQILDTQMETGTPYLVYKDAANRKSNQQNLGTIKSSNLCSEIIEYSSPEETAVCNLASISLPAFVEKDSSGNFVFNFTELRRVVATSVRNLNRVIDINFYPTPETERSNMRHRPVGLGIQGLADVFALMRMDWESEGAARLNQLIFEHMYYSAVETSAALAEEEGSYSSFAGSPASEGRLQPDLWAVEPLTEQEGVLNWEELRMKARRGLRNSLLLAPMPTASTSQILGNNECFEPFTSNLYTRRTLAGEFIIVNKYLLEELRGLGIWSEGIKQEMIVRNGSVQGISAIPEDIQRRYKTGWEIKQRVLIDMAAARGAFVCQSQSLNLFVADATYSKLTSMHFYAWRKGLKTGCYYLRTKAPVMAQKFTVDPRLQAAAQHEKEKEEEEQDSESVSVPSDSDSEEEEKPQTQEEKRQELMRRLTAAYEESVAQAKEEGCLMCGS